MSIHEKQEIGGYGEEGVDPGARKIGKGKLTTPLGMERSVKKRPVLSPELRERILEVRARLPSTDFERIEKIRRPSPQPTIVTELVRAGIPRDIAIRMEEGLRRNWEDFFHEEKTEQGTFFCQDHGIPGLKIYREPRSGKIVADYGLRTIGEGANKRAKKVVRLNGDGEIEYRVRLTKKKERMGSLSPERAREIFKEDIEMEIGARARLYQAGGGKPVPFLLEIIPIKYVDKHGNVKIRYDTEACEGSLDDLLIEETEDGKNIVRLDPRREQEAMLYMSKVLMCLTEMHRRGFVHKDVKPENILFSAGIGLLSDLGFCVRLPDAQGQGGDPYKNTGSLGTAAPEIFFTELTRNSPAMDMFSVGIVLLILAHPQVGSDLRDAQCDLIEKMYEIQEAIKELSARKEKLLSQNVKPDDPDILLIEKGLERAKRMNQAALDAYAKAVKQVQESLRSTQDPLDSLIEELIDLNPARRPTSEGTLKRYIAYTGSQAFQQRFRLRWP